MFALVNNNFNYEDVDDTSFTIQLTSVVAGNLIVLWCKWEEGDTTLSISDGTSSLDTTTHINNGSTVHGCWAYILSTVANGTVTYTFTFGANSHFKRAHVAQFSYSGTIEYDGSTGASGTGTAVDSGTIATTGSEEICLGGYGESNNTTRASHAIDGTAADGVFSGGGSLTDAWYRRLTATDADVEATVTLGTSMAWIGGVIGFKESGAAAATVKQLAALGVG